MAWVRPCPLVSPQTAGPSGSAGGAPTRCPRRVARPIPCRKRILTGREGKPRTPAVRTRVGWRRPETGPGFNLPAAGGRRAARGPKRGAGRPPCGGVRGSVRDGRPSAVCALHGCRWEVGTGTRLAIGRSRTTGQDARPVGTPDPQPYRGRSRRRCGCGSKVTVPVV